LNTTIDREKKHTQTTRDDRLEGIKVLDFHTTLAKYPSDKLTFNRTIKSSDIAAYFHTGGTTGRPKIAQHTHGNEIFNAWMMNEALDLHSPRVFFCGLPWFHVNGVIVTGLLPLTGGHTVLLATPNGYRSEGVIPNFWKIVEHYRVTNLSSVPTILQMLLATPQQGEDLSSLDFAICGAAPLSVQLFNDFEAATGIKIVEGYGFTEGTCANAFNPIRGERKIGSIGLALPHHHIKVVILDEEKKYIIDAEEDEIGIFAARGRNIFPGYKEEIHNKDAFIFDGNHHWYNTGDLGRQDSQGYFWITGRKKELIIRGGHNIDPKSIEEPLSKHPAVAAVAAVARPDKRVGELPMAYVQLKPGHTVDVDVLLDFAEANIKERAAIPKAIQIIDELPLTAVGKIFKPALTKLQIKEVFEHELSQLEEIENAEIKVVQDPQNGTVAEVYVQPTDTTIKNIKLAKMIDEALGAYTVKYKVL